MKRKWCTPAPSPGLTTPGMFQLVLEKSGSQLEGAFAPRGLGNIWKQDELSQLGWFYRHLVKRGRGCCWPSCNEQDSSHYTQSGGPLTCSPFYKKVTLRVWKGKLALLSEDAHSCFRRWFFSRDTYNPPHSRGLCDSAIWSTALKSGGIVPFTTSTRGFSRVPTGAVSEGLWRSSNMIEKGQSNVWGECVSCLTVLSMFTSLPLYSSLHGKL